MSVSATPGRAGTTPLRTPIRDGLHINEPIEGDSMAISTPLIEKQRQLAVRQQLRMGLSALPAPSNKYELLMPEIEDEEDDAEAQMVEDSEDALQRKRDEIRAQEELKLRLRSQVLKRDLPRPLGVNRAYLETADDSATAMEEELRKADEEMRREMLLMLLHEAVEYPIKGGEAPKAHPPYQEMSEDELTAARKLLMEEVAVATANNGRVPPEVFARLWEQASEEYVFVPAKKRALPVSSLSADERLSALKAKLDALQGQVKKETTKAAKLEKRLAVYNGGYQNRANALHKEILDLYMNLDKATVELRCFEALRGMEERALPARLSAIDDELDTLRLREDALQRQFAELSALHRHSAAVAAFSS
jgi:pre-mRNA-splicing factor CDC5/CEF1